MISQLELNNESVNPTKVSGIAPAIKSRPTKIQVQKNGKEH